MAAFLRKFKLQIFFVLVLSGLFFYAPKPASAHENYVLTKEQIDFGMRDYSINVFSALNNPENLKTSILITSAIIAAICLYFVFQHSSLGTLIDRQLNKLEPFGHVLLRTALGVSFLASAATNSYLGPEISVFSLPFGSVIRIVLYFVGAMLILGFLSKFAGAISLAIVALATIVYKDYMLTYFNYYGEFIALIFFGSRVFSLDKKILGLSKFAQKYKQYEIAIIRVTYGISIIYPAISIKLLHPSIIITIVNQYHLNNFHWLFPSDPLLIALGSGLAQVAVGTALILGFQTRLNTFVTFVLMTLSVVVFKESVWPHLILLALAAYLMINNGGKLSLDFLISKSMQNARIAKQAHKLA